MRSLPSTNNEALAFGHQNYNIEDQDKQENAKAPPTPFFLHAFEVFNTLPVFLFPSPLALPFAPSTKGITILTIGMNNKKEIQTRFPIPQIQPKKNAPQFHFFTSFGTSA
jgi:hypothetical protein